MYFYLLPAMNLFYFFSFPPFLHTQGGEEGEFRDARRPKGKEKRIQEKQRLSLVVLWWPTSRLSSWPQLPNPSSFFFFFTFPPSSPTSVCVCGVSSRLNIFLQNRLFDDDEKMITAIVSFPNQLEIVSLSWSSPIGTLLPVFLVFVFSDLKQNNSTISWRIMHRSGL